MREYKITVGGRRYTGVTASAKNQFKALHIVGSSTVITALKDGFSDMGSVIQLLQLPMEKIEELYELLVMDSVKREEDEIPVAENLFHENIQDYYLLLVKVMRENLQNFWKLRRPEGKDADQAEPQKG